MTNQSGIRAYRRFGWFALCTAAGFSALIWPGFWSQRGRLTLGKWYFGAVLWGTGMRIKVSGQEHIPAGAALFAGNHISYMDIAVLHSLVPASFVAKAEVGRMPVFGAMTWVNGTILVDRGAKNPREILRQIGLMGERLARGHPVILFAEGTSTDDGSKVQPFKGVLFKGLRPATPIVPFTLALQGQNRDIYTWYGDDVLGDLMRLFGYKKVEIHVVFHPAMYRKEDGEPVAKRVEEVVRHSHNALTYGADKGERGAL